MERPTDVQGVRRRRQRLSQEPAVLVHAQVDPKPKRRRSRGHHEGGKSLRTTGSRTEGPGPPRNQDKSARQRRVVDEHKERVHTGDQGAGADATDKN